MSEEKKWSDAEIFAEQQAALARKEPPNVGVASDEQFLRTQAETVKPWKPSMLYRVLSDTTLLGLEAQLNELHRQMGEISVQGSIYKDGANYLVLVKYLEVSR